VFALKSVIITVCAVFDGGAQMMQHASASHARSGEHHQRAVQIVPALSIRSTNASISAGRNRWIVALLKEFAASSSYHSGLFAKGFGCVDGQRMSTKIGMTNPLGVHQLVQHEHDLLHAANTAKQGTTTCRHARRCG